VSSGTLEDVSPLMLFTTHLGLECASSDDDESPWIKPLKYVVVECLVFCLIFAVIAIFYPTILPNLAYL
jgi:hypothetical protein